MNNRQWTIDVHFDTGRQALTYDLGCVEPRAAWAKLALWRRVFGGWAVLILSASGHPADRAFHSCRWLAGEDAPRWQGQWADYRRREAKVIEGAPVVPPMPQAPPPSLDYDKEVSR